MLIQLQLSDLHMPKKNKQLKGKTENDLMSLGFKNAYMFRPAFIQPLKGIRSRTPLYQGIYNIMRHFYGLLKHFPSSVTDTTTLGQAMIGVCVNGFPKAVLESRDINTFK